VVAKLSVTTSPKDHPISYHRYDSNGKRLTQTALRDEGGNILCTKVTVPSEIPGGSPIVYEKAYYDIQKKRFFLKTEDPNDGNMKPNGYVEGPNGTVQVNLYLPETATGEYVESTYIYEFYDMFDTYVDANGETRTQLNSTYMYVIPSKITRVYSLTSNGEKTLLSEDPATAEAGVYDYGYASYANQFAAALAGMTSDEFFTALKTAEQGFGIKFEKNGVTVNHAQLGMSAARPEDINFLLPSIILLDSSFCRNTILVNNTQYF
jgi:hypothetical protein